MTEEEKKILRQKKSDCVEWLQENLMRVMMVHEEAFEGTDPRMADYLHGLTWEPDKHNLYELLAAERFLRMLLRYEWRPTSVRRFAAFYEALRFNGTKGRTRYRLTPVQYFQFANIFGFYGSDGLRLTLTAYIFVPRKFSKTTSAASLAVYDMMFGDNNAQAYVGANSYDQAKICFDEIRAIMMDLDPKKRHFKVNREKIMYTDGSRDSFIQCLTANAKTKDGLHASLAIMDEYSQARNTAGKNGADLKNVLTSSMGPRREPLTVIITTASEVVDGPFAHELEHVKAILRGEAENDTIFAAVFMPDVDDEESDPRTWAKVQPHMGITVRPDYYAKEYANALLSAENMLTFRTKLLNVFTVNEQKTWFTWEKAKELVGDFDIDKVDGHPSCAVAFDLSVRDDFSAVSYTIYSESTKRFYAHTDYYIPEGSLPGHPNEQLYRRWVADGHLRLCKGARIDVRMICNDILLRSKRVKIVRIGYDAWKCQELVNCLIASGASGILQSYSQTYGSFNLPVEAFEMLAYADPPLITLNDNPINVFCLTNCVIDTDTLENKKPLKISHNRKIDGTVTVLMTIGQLYSYER